jgi:hypothetical protein
MVPGLRAILPAALTALLWSVPVRADVVEESQTDGSWTFWFRDDPVASDGRGPRDGIIIGPHRAVRTLLIRPRTQFIREMCKSVEHM